MAVDHVLISALLLLVILLSDGLSNTENTTERLICVDLNLRVCFRRRFCAGRTKYPLVKFSKHGVTVLALPVRFINLEVYSHLVCCGDIHPHPGPTNSHDGLSRSSIPTSSRISYSPSQLRQILHTSNISTHPHPNLVLNNILLREKLSRSDLLCPTVVYLLGVPRKPIPTFISPRRYTGKKIKKFVSGHNRENCILINLNGTNYHHFVQSTPSKRIGARSLCPPSVKTIPTRITSRAIGFLSSPPYDKNRPRSSHCLKRIEISHQPHSISRLQLPNFLNANVRSLVSKTDELALLMNQHHISVTAISESWLHNGIDSSLIHISGYTLFRRDRLLGRGGGVCAYVSDIIPCKRRLDLENPSFECLWLWVRPHRLPRSITGILVGVVYSPPDTSALDQLNLICYLTENLDIIRNESPDCGLVLLGDFNHLDISDILNSHNLFQAVNEPTRNSAILDLIITNMQTYYNKPAILAPIGTSDHNVVKWLPCCNNICTTRLNNKCQLRRFPRSERDAFGRWLTSQDWSADDSNLASVEDLSMSFTSKISQAIDDFFPLRSIKLHHSDKQWMTASIKKIILERQQAYHSGNSHLWRHYRNKVKSEIISRKKKFYSEKVQHLKKTDSRKWWKYVNQISGRSSASYSSPFVLEKNGIIMSPDELVNSLNNFFVSVNADIPAFDLSNLPSFLPSSDQIPAIYPYQVCEKLLKLNPHKAIGPDKLPPRIFKDFAYELAEPITDIFNISLNTGVVPTIWKAADIIPIPKESPPKIENDLRPISLTPCLSKVLEEFVATWILEDIQSKIDPRQFGCLKGTSTSMCLLDIFHRCLSSLDKSGNTLRICLLDFSKAFDRINLNTLIVKLIDLGVRRSILPWICSFLSNRKQRVKLGESISEWAVVNAGVPQGTKLGPILFLVMVNDLVPPNCQHWKYVDDVTILEVMPRHGQSIIQSDLDHIVAWSTSNYMKLNPKKCKELRVCFLRDPPSLSQLVIDSTPVEVVECHKVLGVQIQNNLKWRNHVDVITKKAAKRLYILRILRHSAGVPPRDLITIYIALIQSILEYACAVWHSSLPSFLADKIEQIQRRALRIIYPYMSYREALVASGCPRLIDNRQRLCLNLFNKIRRNSTSQLASFIPKTRSSAHGRHLRSNNNLSLYRCNTERFKRSFFPSMTSYFNQIHNP